MRHIRLIEFVALGLVLLLLAWPTIAGAAPALQSTDTPAPTDTPTATSTPAPTDTSTPAPTATSLYDVDVVLPNGAHYLFENRITLGEFAVVLACGLLLLVLVPYVCIRVLRLWI